MVAYYKQRKYIKFKQNFHVKKTVQNCDKGDILSEIKPLPFLHNNDTFIQQLYCNCCVYYINKEIAEKLSKSYP